MTHFKNADHFLLMTIIALLAEVGICIAYWQGLVTIVGLVTAHLGLIWVLAVYSDRPNGETKLTRRHKAQLALTTLLGPIGPLLILIWLGLVWLQSTVAVRLFGTEPIFEAIAESNKVIDAYRRAEKERADQLKTANDLLFGDRKQIARALDSLSDHNDGLSHAQVQGHLQGSDTSLSTLAALAQKRIDEASAGAAGDIRERTRDDDDATKEQNLERARQLLKEHVVRLRGAPPIAPNGPNGGEADLISLVGCLFQLGEFEAVRHLLSKGNTTSQRPGQADLSKYQTFWQS